MKEPKKPVQRPAESIDNLKEWLVAETFWRSKACGLLTLAAEVIDGGTEGVRREELVRQLREAADEGFDL